MNYRLSPRHVRIAMLWVAFVGVGLRAGEDIPSSVATISKALSSDEMGGRSPGSSGSKLAQVWLSDWMREHGFRPAGKGGLYLQSYGRGANLLGMVGPEGSPTVLLTAHYDHVGTTCDQHPKARSAICNGAADNAAAVAAVLVAAAQLADKVNSPVAVALWDGEELGYLGAKYFLAKPAFSLEALRLIINIDVLGADLFQGMEQTLLCMGMETGGSALKEDVEAVLEGAGLRPVALSYAFGHGRSDPTAFIDHNVNVPIVFFSDGAGPTYHTTADEFENLNLEKVAAVTSLVSHLAQRAASRAEGYGFVAPTMVRSLPIPHFEDTASLLSLVEDVLTHAEANGLARKQKKMLQQFKKQLRAMREGGEEGFGAEQIKFVLEVAGAVQQMSQSRALD